MADLPTPVEPGNIDLSKRPIVHNPDGTISTIRSMSVNMDGLEVLLPTLSPDGKQLSDDEAIELYKSTGQHLGKFKTVDEATAFAKALSKHQGEAHGGSNVDRAVSAIQYLDAVTPEEVGTPAADRAVTEAQDAQRYTAAEKRENLSGWDYAEAIWSQTTTAGLYDWAVHGSRWEPDPENWTLERYKERFAEDQKLLPENMWSDLHGAVSEKHYDYLRERALYMVDMQRRIAEGGFSVGAASFLAQVVNPAELALGYGTYTIGARIAMRLAHLGTAAQRLSNAGIGAAGAIGSVAAQDYLGIPVEDSEYLLAAGLGITLGATFGPLGQNPALAREAAEAVRIGEALMDHSEELLRKAGTEPVKAPSKAAMDRAAEESRADAAQKTQNAPETPVSEAPATTLPEPKEAAPTTPESPSIGETVEQAIQDTPLAEAVPPGAVRETIDNIVEQVTPQPKAEAPAATPDPDLLPGALSDRKVAAQALDDALRVNETTEIELSPALLKNPRNISAYRAADGAEYRIVSEGDDPTGPYKVVSGTRTVASGVETLAEARSHIPGLTGPQSAGRVAEELAPIAAAPVADSPQAARIESLKGLRSAGKEAHEAAIAALKAENLKLADLDEIARGLMAGTSKYRSKAKAMEAIERFFSRARQTDRRLERTKGIFALAEAKPLPGKLGDEPAGYTFRGFEYRKQSDDGELTYYTIHKRDTGEQVGEVEIATQDGRRYISWQEIDEQYRGTAAAHGALLVAAKHGAPWIPDGTLSADSFPMWAKRLPWVGEFYRPDPARPTSGWMVSPKRLLKDFEGLLNSREEFSRLKASVTSRGEEWSGSYKSNENALNRKIAAYQKTLDSLPPEATDPENLRTMFAAKRDPMSAVVSKPEARQIVEETLERILPKQVAKVIDDEIVKSGALDGLYKDRTVFVALNSDKPLAVAYHETTHALRQLGLISQREWNKLRNWAKKNGAHEKYKIKERYADENLTPDELDEEAIAHALGDKLAGRALGDAEADTIMDKVIDFLRRLRDALGIRGFRTTRDLFDDIESGAIARRAQRGDLNDAAFRARAARAPAPAYSRETGAPLWQKDSDWQSIHEEDIPYSGGFWRFDRGGASANSTVAAERMIGPALLNDSVGKADHSLNPFSADQMWRQDHAKALNELGATVGPAYQKWADDKMMSPYTRNLPSTYDQFDTEVGLYLRTLATDPKAVAPHPSIKAVADKIATLQAKDLADMKNPLAYKGMTGRPVSGAELAEQDLTYLWRKYRYDRFNEMMRMVGYDEMVRLFRSAMESAWAVSGKINPATLDRVAKGYVRQLARAAAGLEENWDTALAIKDFQKLERLMMQDAGIDSQTAKHVIKLLNGGDEPAHGTGILRRKVLLDETMQIVSRDRNTGEAITLKLTDLLDNRASRVFERYNRLTRGLVALGRVQVKSPKGGYLINGITSDDDWSEIINNLKMWAADRGINPAEIEASVERLQFAYDRIRGVPLKQQGKPWAKALRLVRAYMTTRLLGMGGVAQLGEHGTLVGNMGVRAAFSHFPGFKKMIDSAGDQRYAAKLYEDLMSIGLGPNRLHGLTFYHNLDEVGELPFSHEGGSLLDKMLNWGKVGERLTHAISGMSGIQGKQLQAAGAMMATRMANIGAKLRAGRGLSEGDKRRLAQLNIDEPMMKRIFDQLEAAHSLEENPFFAGKKVAALNLEKWTDLEARAHFENALYRTANKLIQTGDEGSLALWMHDAVAQTFFQFRSFPFSAWANHFQYALHMRDPQALFGFMWSVGWAAALRGAQVKLIALTRSDRAEYEEKYLSPWELGKAGFERSGWSSIIPMGLDTAMTVLGQDALFNSRSTGQPSDAIFGSPALSMLTALSKGAGGFVNSVTEGREMSQPELRSLASILPFSNTIPFQMGLSHMIADREETTPRKERD